MIELLKTHLDKHRIELDLLQKRHDAMVTEFNLAVQQNQNRYQQLSGAIAELELLLQEKTYGANNGARQPGTRSHDSAR